MTIPAVRLTSRPDMRQSAAQGQSFRWDHQDVAEWRVAPRRVFIREFCTPKDKGRGCTVHVIRACIMHRTQDRTTDSSLRIIVYCAGKGISGQRAGFHMEVHNRYPGITTSTILLGIFQHARGCPVPVWAHFFSLCSNAPNRECRRNKYYRLH